jgi:hypothetical protein
MRAPKKICPKCGAETTRLVTHDNKAHKRREKPRYNKPPLVRIAGGGKLKTTGRLRV